MIKYLIICLLMSSVGFAADDSQTKMTPPPHKKPEVVGDIAGGLWMAAGGAMVYVEHQVSKNSLKKILGNYLVRVGEMTQEELDAINKGRPKSVQLTKADLEEFRELRIVPPTTKELEAAVTAGKPLLSAVRFRGAAALAGKSLEKIAGPVNILLGVYLIYLNHHETNPDKKAENMKAALSAIVMGAPSMASLEKMSTTNVLAGFERARGLLGLKTTSTVAKVGVEAEKLGESAEGGLPGLAVGVGWVASDLLADPIFRAVNKPTYNALANLGQNKELEGSYLWNQTHSDSFEDGVKARQKQMQDAMAREGYYNSEAVR